MKTIFGENSESKSSNGYFENWDHNDFRAKKVAEGKYYDSFPEFGNQETRSRGLRIFHALFGEFQNVGWNKQGIYVGQIGVLLKVPFAQDCLFGSLYASVDNARQYYDIRV